MHELVTIDKAGAKRELKYLIRSPALSVIMLHECASIIKHYLIAFENIETVFFVLTWSWHCPKQKAVQFRLFIDGLIDKFPNQAKYIRNNIIFAMNSDEEAALFREALIGQRVINVNNGCFLSESIFNNSSAELGEIPVMNAKPLAFKRHELTTLINPKIFVSYDEAGCLKHPAYRDIRHFGATQIFWDIQWGEVAKINNEGLCGLALSEIEGACYASTEYLLCGMPVISTSSLGGRHQYYDLSNSIIVDPSPEDVALGVSKVRARRDEFDRAVIHRKAVARSRAFRYVLANELAAATAQDCDFFFRIIDDTVRDDNKLRRHRNFWIEALKPTDDNKAAECGRRIVTREKTGVRTDHNNTAVSFEFRGKLINEKTYGSAYLKELDKILSDLDPPPSKILEWGSGLSTLLLIKKAKKWSSNFLLSIDDNTEYQKSVFSGMEHPDFLKFIALDQIGPCKNQSDTGLNYSSYPLSFGETFDLIYIDGRRRIECAYNAALLSHSGTIILLHDYRRSRYQSVLGLFDVIADGPQFRVMRLRPELVEPFAHVRQRIVQKATGL